MSLAKGELAEVGWCQSARLACSGCWTRQDYFVRLARAACFVPRLPRLASLAPRRPLYPNKMCVHSRWSDARADCAERQSIGDEVGFMQAQVRQAQEGARSRLYRESASRVPRSLVGRLWGEAGCSGTRGTVSRPVWAIVGAGELDSPSRGVSGGWCLAPHGWRADEVRVTSSPEAGNDKKDCGLANGAQCG